MTLHEKLEYLRGLKGGVFTAAELQTLFCNPGTLYSQQDHSEFIAKIDAIYDQHKKELTLEEAINELGRHSWTAVNVISGSEDFTTSQTREHMKTCLIIEHYRQLFEAATKVKAAWLKEKKEKS